MKGASANVTGSKGAMPNRSDLSTRQLAAAAGNPTSIPAMAGFIPSRRMNAATLDPVDPNAIRTPISVRRWETA